MGEGYRLSAYWGASHETDGEIATRLTNCFHRLNAVHPAFSDWRDHWRSEEEWLAGPKEPWKLDLPNVTALVESGRSRNDDNEPIEVLGFMASGWTGGWDGNEDAGVRFHITAGVHSKFMAPNSFMLELPSPHDAAPGLFDSAIIRSALEAVVESWQPVWATFTCDRLFEAQQPSSVLYMSDPDYERKLSQPKDGRPKMPTVGWLTYLGKQDFPEVPREGLPNSVKIDRTGQGTYVTFGEDPLGVSEQDAVALYRLLERPFNAHPFTGVRKDESFDYPAYRAKMAGVPNGVEYVANGYRFDGYRDGKLRYAHDQYEFDAEDGQLRPAEIRDEFLAKAGAQIEAAQGYPVFWFFPQRDVALAVEAMLAGEQVSEIYVRYVAP